MKPFLQWPGGKARVAPLLIPHFNLPCRRFIEPFCGAASVSLAVAEMDGAEYFWCNDINRDLVNTLIYAMSSPENLIDIARGFFEDCAMAAEMDAYYYAMRRAFNQFHHHPDMDTAAQFLFLDFHCYNALIRYNAKGEFNSPFRRDRKIAAFPEQAIRDFARLMKGARFTCQDFETVMAQAGPGDVVYCDPPYIPLSPTANFTGYSAGGFGMDDQIRLAEAAKRAAMRGARVVVSNSDTPEAREVYDGAEIHEIHVHRSISCKGDGRGKAGEIVAVVGS
jgi:DNA adenine methylase